MPSSLSSSSRTFLTAMVLVGCLLLPTRAAAQIQGEYTGLFSFFNQSNLLAELSIPKNGKKIDAVLTLRHFKEEIGPERVESKARVELGYDEKSHALTLTFKSWMGEKPYDSDLILTSRRAVFDPAKREMKGDGFEFVMKDSGAVGDMQRQQAMFDTMQTSQRQAADDRAKRAGTYAEAERRIAGRAQEARNVAAARGGDSAPSTRSLLDRAGGRSGKCQVLDTWLSRVRPELPPGFRGTSVSPALLLNLFRDEEFVPVFGRAFDSTTAEWRLTTFTKEIQPCQAQSRSPDMVLSNGYAMAGAAFGYSRGADSPEEIIAIVQTRRRQAGELAALQRGQVDTSIEGYRTLERQLVSLKSYGELWPSELAAVQRTLTARKVDLAGRIVPPWRAGLLQLPAAFENAVRLNTELASWRAPLAELVEAERAPIVASIEQRLDAMLTGLLSERLSAIAAVPPTEAGIHAWARLNAELRREFGEFSRPPVEHAHQRAIAILDERLQQFLPAWKKQIDETPASTAGLYTARQMLPALFADPATREAPSYRAYGETVIAFVNAVYANLESLADNAPSGSPEARAFFKALVPVPSAAGADLIRRVRSVRLVIDTRALDSRWRAAFPDAQILDALAPALSAIGLTVNASAEASLTLRLHSQTKEVITTSGFQQVRSQVWGLGASASLEHPGLVIRASGFYAVPVTLAAAVSGRVSTGPDPAPAALGALIRETVLDLPEEATLRSKHALTTEGWREFLLDFVPRMDASFATRTTVATARGLEPLFNRSTRVGSLDFGISALNRAGVLDLATPFIAARDVFDPRPVWSRIEGQVGWSVQTSGDRTLPVPVHTYAAYPGSVHQTVFGVTVATAFERMDQAAIREPACVIVTAGSPVRTTCLSLHAESFSLDITLGDGLDEQIAETVRNLQLQMLPER